MGGKARELAKAFDELHQLGAVEVQTAQEALALKKYAERQGRIISLQGGPGNWRIYDATQPVGWVV